MSQSKDPKFPGTPQGNPPGKPDIQPTQPAGRSGRVVHDARGNAVWDFLKETSRIAIESTSRLLRRLEAPELKVEDPKDEELRLVDDKCAGGGYDPYSKTTAKPVKRGNK
jgi:hypothetical protein